MYPKHALVLVNNNLCVFILSINNSSRCPRNTPNTFSQVWQSTCNLKLQTMHEHSLLHNIITQNCFVNQASPPQVSKHCLEHGIHWGARNKNELRKKESINWARSHIEHPHHCFSCNWGDSKGNINLVTVVEYVDTIEQERNQAWRISHWGAP